LKTYNCDYFFTDKKIIEQAIRIVCDNKKKKKSNNYKYKQAKHILSNIDKYICKMQNIIFNTQKKLELLKKDGKVPLEIEKKCFHPKKCKSFTINDSKKVRTITSVPLFPDQVIQEIVILIFKDTLFKKFYYHSYASLPKKGIHAAAKYTKKIIKNNKNNNDIKYICKLDIKKCYPSTSHKLIKYIINKKFRGSLFKNILFEILDSYHESIDSKNNKIGIAIGFSVSQWICNVVLTYVDNYIKHKLKIKYYIRYMDDMVLFSKNKKELHKKFKLLRIFLFKMGYKVKENWQIFKFHYANKNKENGRFLDFLGFKFYRNKTTLRKNIFLRIKRQAKKIKKLKYKYTSICRSFISRVGWLRHFNSLAMYKKYIKKYVSIKKIKEVISNEDKLSRQTSISI